jgi:hypothetical protein
MMQAPKISIEQQKVRIGWNNPAEENITGYVILFGP